MTAIRVTSAGVLVARVGEPDVRVTSFGVLLAWVPNTDPPPDDGEPDPIARVINPVIIAAW